MASIMTVRAPTDLQEILSLQAKNLGLARNALILQILWDWAERQGTTVGHGDEQEERRKRHGTGADNDPPARRIERTTPAGGGQAGKQL